LPPLIAVVPPSMPRPRRSARCRPRAAPSVRCVKFTPDCRRDLRRLGADVDRFSFIVSDFHQLLLAGLLAHFESDMPSHGVGLCGVVSRAVRDEALRRDRCRWRARPQGPRCRHGGERRPSTVPMGSPNKPDPATFTTTGRTWICPSAIALQSLFRGTWLTSTEGHGTALSASRFAVERSRLTARCSRSNGISHSTRPSNRQSG
jgi:hypothetical protein